MRNLSSRNVGYGFDPSRLSRLRFGRVYASHGPPKVYRVLALSGGFARVNACQQRAQNPGMIASFSRALLEDLQVQMHEAEFDHALDRTLKEVMRATTDQKLLT